MKKIPFSHQEFVIRKDLPVPNDVIDKIWEYHINPLTPVRYGIGSPVIVSKHSGFRHEIHETEMGRTELTSTHLFREIVKRQDPGYGACDLRVTPVLWGKFIEELIDKTDYSRIAFYPHMTTPFAHCDYRFIGVDRFFYVVDMTGGWIQVGKEELIYNVYETFGIARMNPIT